MFTPHIDTSHYARTFDISTNITINSPPISLPNTTPSFNVNSIVSPVMINLPNTRIVNLSTLQQNLPTSQITTKPEIEQLKLSAGLCTPTPYVQVCYNSKIDVNGNKNSNISVEGKFIIKGKVEIPISDRFKKDIMEGAELLNRYPM